MFLETHRITALLCWTLSAPGAWADSNVAYPIQYRFQGAFGFDAWDISKNSESSVMDRLLFLADSTPQWSERNPSPWVRFDSEALFSQQLSGRFKFRGSQSSDWRIDELNLNWQASPTLGATIGVVDYKTSWCRAYDVDSPWVRENDPFCTVRTTEQATGAAPGAQLHTNWTAGAWMWQALIGTYNPLLLDYDEEEFNNQILDNDSFVDRNRKQGVSVNAVHLHTGAEFRLSYLKTEQLGKYQPGSNVPFYDKPQNVDVIYAGISLPIHPRVQFRLTHLNSELTSRYLPNDFPQNIWIYDFDYDRKSTTAEVFWKFSDLDTLALGFSEYATSEKTQITWRPDTRFDFRLNTSEFKNESWSLSWRRDWSGTFYTAVQWTKSESVDKDSALTNFIPARFNNRRLEADGHAIGVRLGVRF